MALNAARLELATFSVSLCGCKRKIITTRTSIRGTAPYLVIYSIKFMASSINPPLKSTAQDLQDLCHSHLRFERYLCRETYVPDLTLLNASFRAERTFHFDFLCCISIMLHSLPLVKMLAKLLSNLLWKEGQNVKQSTHWPRKLPHQSRPFPLLFLSSISLSPYPLPQT